MTQPIRVFIGTDPSQLGAAEILKQTIIEKSSCPIQVETMEKLHIPQPRDARQSQRTGISFARWAIPQLCAFKGRAIYIDADMMVFTDIKELWETPMNGATIAIVDGSDASYCSDKTKGNKNETSVMLLDCEKAQWTLEELVDGLDGRYQYKDMMTDLCFLKEQEISRSIPRRWNAMDYWDETVSLLHYTNVPTQPWVCVDNPYGYVWVNNAKRLIKEGKIFISIVEQQVDKGYFRPSLMEELRGETCINPTSEYANKLREIDRKARYVPHRDLTLFQKKRNKAIRIYELKQARAQNLQSYMKLMTNYITSDIKNFTKKILRRA